jgi:hypothetical protein
MRILAHLRPPPQDCKVRHVAADITGITAAKPEHDGSLKIVAHVLTGLLAADITAAAARLAVPSLLNRSDRPFQAQIDIKPIVVLSRVAFVATVVMFLIWFYLARVEAEQSDWPQRRARAWSFWGWVIPIADLWIPFQIMGDIWRAHLPPSRRHKTAWLPVAWWTAWLLTSMRSARQHAGYGQVPSTWWQFAPGGLGISRISQRGITTEVIQIPGLLDVSAVATRSRSADVLETSELAALIGAGIGAVTLIPRRRRPRTT